MEAFIGRSSYQLYAKTPAPQRTSAAISNPSRPWLEITAGMVQEPARKEIIVMGTMKAKIMRAFLYLSAAINMVRHS